MNEFLKFRLTMDGNRSLVVVVNVRHAVLYNGPIIRYGIIKMIK
jgi:hypothetical protein